MMHPRHVFVDLPKDRRPEVYRFRSPRGEAKGGGGAFHLLGKSKLRSRKNAHSRCRILRRSKPSSTSVEVDCPKLVTDLGRPRFDVVETEVTHGQRNSSDVVKPPAFPSSRISTEFQSRTALRAVARGASQLTYRCSSRLRLFNLREGPRSSAAERDPQSSGTPPAQELETNFDEFSACSDAEAVSGGVVRVSMLVAPQGVLRIVHMTTATDSPGPSSRK